jgi:hypothetical protein
METNIMKNISDRQSSVFLAREKAAAYTLEH